MKSAVLSGKPYAGNPHVRFDEGEVASAKSSRGSLLYKTKIVLVAAVVAAGSFAGAAEYTWNGDECSSWRESSSYKEAATPGPGDTVIIPNGGHATVTDDDAALVSSLAVVEVGSHTRVIFDTTTNVTLGCSIRLPVSTASYTADAVLVKKGACDLRCASYGRDYTGSNSYDYRILFDVQEGSVSFPDKPDTEEKRIVALVGIEIAAGAEWRLGGGTTFNVGSFHGEGSITNAGETATLAVIKYDSEFSGVIGGDIKMQGTAKGTVTTLTGTNNTHTSFYTYNGGEARILKFGNAGEPSSIGTNDEIRCSADGGRWTYLGEGETTDKAFVFTQSDNPATLDAGATGNLVFTGQFGQHATSATMRRMALDGSNRLECVYSGSFYEGSRSGVPTSTYITKRGSGTWHFTDNASRKNAGVIAVENGTLRFDSIAEKGTVCSLGLSTALCRDAYALTRTDEDYLPYAYLLGGETTEGTLEYAGSTDAYCSTRPMAVRGRGRLRNGTDCAFFWQGIYGLGDGANTLTLDGDSTLAENRLDTLTNACGTLSLVKEGAGTWILSGEQEVNGTVDVRAGALVVRQERYYPTYYRLTIKRNIYYYLNSIGEVAAGGNAATRNVMLREWAMYDAEGVRCDKNLEFVSDVTDVAALEPGQVIQTRGTLSTKQDRLPDKLSNDLYNDIWHGISNCGSGSLNPNVEGSWIQLVMRLSDAAHEVTAYDYSCRFGRYTDSSKTAKQADDTREYQLGEYLLEGSLDGEEWYEITNVVNKAEQDYPGLWQSDNTPAAANQVRKGLGYPVNSRYFDATLGRYRAPAQHLFDSVASVSVAAGATLKAELSDGSEIALKGLTVDPSASGGTIDGFAFAAAGTVNVTSYKAIRSGASVTFAFRNAKGVENISDWTLLVEGKPDARCSMTFDPETGTMRFFKPGAVIIVR